MTDPSSIDSIEKGREKQDPYFTPLDTQAPLNIPDSISDGVHDEILDSPALALKPLHFLGKAITGLIALVLLLTLWQTVEFYRLLLDTHWMLAAVFTALLVFLSGMIGKAALEFFRYQRDFREVVWLQKQAEALQQSHSSEHSTQWLGSLRQLYQGKPQEPMLEQALTTLADYSDDSEMLHHIDSHLLNKLDQQALARISRHSQQVALMVALSPFAAVDMLLAAWRSLKMVDEICQIYGIRPSFAARTRLMRMVLEQMTLAGTTELLSDQLADFTSNRLLGVISSQAASGLGVGLYSARIGLRVMGFCRPIPFPPSRKPGIASLAKVIRASIEKRFETKG